MHSGMDQDELRLGLDRRGCSLQAGAGARAGNADVVRGAAVWQQRLAVSMRRSRSTAGQSSSIRSGCSTLQSGFHAYYAGRWDEAEAAFRKALELNPQFPGAHSLLGRIYLAQSKPEEALAEMQKEPEPLWREYGLALAYHAAGKKKEADAALAEFIEKYQNEAAFQIAEIYAYRGETDKAFEWLERAYKQRDGGLAEMKGDPLLRSLHGDPRWPAFLKKMKLPVD